jgi:hypothetical protein
MIKQKLTKKCKNCGKEFRIYRTTDKFCSYHCANNYGEIKPINKNSIKQKERLKKYNNLRKAFLSLPENKFCFVDGCNNLANTVEHTAGRIGENLLKISTWEPCCNKHNLEFETNPELSKKYQVSRFHSGKKIEK